MADNQQLEEWLEVAETDPDDLVDKVAAITNEIDQPDPEKRNKAVKILSQVATRNPGSVADERAALIERLSDEHQAVRYNAALTLKRIATAYPNALLGVLFPVAGRLGDEEQDVQTAVGDVLDAVSDQYPEEVIEAVSTVLTDLATDLNASSSEERKTAAMGFAVAASVAPEAIAANLEALIDSFTDGSLDVRYHSVMAVSRVATEDGSAVTAAVDALSQLLGKSDDDVRKLAAYTLAEVAGTVPDMLTAETDSLVDALSDDYDEVRQFSVKALTKVADQHPEAIAPYADVLIERVARDADDIATAAAEVLTALAAADAEPVKTALTDRGVSINDDPPAAIEAVRLGEKTLNSVADDDGHKNGEKNRQLDNVINDTGRTRVESLTDAVDEVIGDDPAVGAVDDTVNYRDNDAIELNFEANGDCAYTREVGITTWRCPHDPMEEGDFCLFHAPVNAKDDKRVAEALLETANSKGRRLKEFVGARFGDIDLSFAILAADDNFPIDLRHAHVTGDLLCDRLSIRQPLRAQGLTVSETADFEAAVFETLADFEKATFGAAVFNQVEFKGETVFRGARFAGDTKFRDVVFSRAVNFEQAQFEQDAELRKMSVMDILKLDDATFNKRGMLAGIDADQVRLNGASVDGDLNLRALNSGQLVSIDGLTVANDLIFSVATIDGALTGEDVEVGGSLNLTNANISRSLMFENVTVKRTIEAAGMEANQIHIKKLAVDDFELRTLRAHGFCLVQDADITGDFTLFNSRFENGFQSENVTVGGKLKASQMQVQGEFLFVNGSIGEAATFRSTIFERGGSFLETTFRSKTTFQDTTFSRGTSFSDVNFIGLSSFIGAEFAESVDFSDATFDSTPNFSDAVISDGQFIRVNTNGAGIIDLSGATFADGTVTVPSGEDIVYDLRNTTVGDVELGINNDEEARPLFEHFRFLNTTFDGFDFGPYKDELSATDWQIHTTIKGVNPVDKESMLATLAGMDADEHNSESLQSMATWELNKSELVAIEEAISYDDPVKLQTECGERLADEIESIEPPGAVAASPGQLENTYLRAKNGANNIGDNTAAAEFFRKEMHYRRMKYGHLIRSGGYSKSSLRLAVKWVGNALLNVSCGHGERPSRTVYLSVVTILVFTGLYAFLGIELPYEGMAGYLTFSLESFVALVLGQPQTTNSITTFAVALESFLGGFIIALFVFTLTRSINR